MGVIYKNSVEYGAGGGGAATQSMTKAEYNTLTDDQKNNGTIYFITDENDDVVVTADNTTYSNTSSGLTATDVQAAIDEVAANAGGATMELTKASYDALPSAEKSNGTMYFVTDEDSIVNSAVNVSYSNTTSGLSAEDVQEAIDEIASEKQDASTAITTSNISSQTVAEAGKATNDSTGTGISTQFGTINEKIGSTNISTIGGGTLTGAISSLNSSLGNLKNTYFYMYDESTSTDFNQLTNSGIYMVRTITNAPITNNLHWFSLTVTKFANGYITQSATCLDTAENFVRNSVNGTWYAWQRLANGYTSAITGGMRYGLSNGTSDVQFDIQNDTKVVNLGVHNYGTWLGSTSIPLGKTLATSEDVPSGYFRWTSTTESVGVEENKLIKSIHLTKGKWIINVGGQLNLTSMTTSDRVQFFIQSGTKYDGWLCSNFPPNPYSCIACSAIYNVTEETDIDIKCLSTKSTSFVRVSVSAIKLGS